MRPFLLIGSIALVCILSLNACKKDRLEGDNAVMIGTWQSTTTVANCGIVVGIPTNPNLKLELLEKGRYKLYRDGDKIETGTLEIQSGFVAFKCRKKSSELNDKRVMYFNADTLGIDLNDCGDDFAFRFIRP